MVSAELEQIARQARDMALTSERDRLYLTYDFESRAKASFVIALIQHGAYRAALRAPAAGRIGPWASAIPPVSLLFPPAGTQIRHPYRLDEQESADEVPCRRRLGPRGAAAH
jgi:hypothetical protein